MSEAITDPAVLEQLAKATPRPGSAADPLGPDPLTREGVLADFPGLSDVQVSDELRHRKGIDR